VRSSRCPEGERSHPKRWRKHSIDNMGEFMIVDPNGNYVVAGARFDFTADDVVAFCAQRMAR